MAQEAHGGVVVDEDRACPECGSDRLVRDPVRGEVVCDACGLVIQDLAIDEGPEWTAYSAEESERLAHTGAPRDPLGGASGLTTVISAVPRDGRGNPVPVRDQRTYERLRRLQRRSSFAGPGERSLPAMVQVLNRYAAVLDLPRPVRDEAAFLCRKAVDKHLLRGRSTESVVAGAVYAACRIRGVPRTLEELEAATGIPKKALGRVYRTVRRTIGLGVPAPQPEEYLRRFCSVLGLSPRAEAAALRNLQVFEGSASISPAGTTAAAVYLATIACDEPRPQSQIARVAGVSEVTLRNRYKAMCAALRPGADGNGASARRVGARGIPAANREGTVDHPAGGA